MSWFKAVLSRRRENCPLNGRLLRKQHVDILCRKAFPVRQYSCLRGRYQCKQRNKSLPKHLRTFSLLLTVVVYSRTPSMSSLVLVDVAANRPSQNPNTGISALQISNAVWLSNCRQTSPKQNMHAATIHRTAVLVTMWLRWDKKLPRRFIQMLTFVRTFNLSVTALDRWPQNRVPFTGYEDIENDGTLME